MTQTVKGSFVEAWINIFVGFGINYAMNAFVLAALMGVAITWRTNLWYGVIMTAVSLVRSFVLRRIFNRIKFGNKELAR